MNDLVSRKAILAWIKTRKSALESLVEQHTGYHKRHLSGQHSSLVDLEWDLEEGQFAPSTEGAAAAIHEDIQEIEEALAGIPFPWSEEGKEIWYRGDGYEGNDAHRWICDISDPLIRKFIVNAPTRLCYLIDQLAEERAATEGAEAMGKRNVLSLIADKEALTRELAEAQEEIERLRKLYEKGREVADMWKNTAGTAKTEYETVFKEVERLLPELGRLSQENEWLRSEHEAMQTVLQGFALAGFDSATKILSTLSREGDSK